MTEPITDVRHFPDRKRVRTPSHAHKLAAPTWHPITDSPDLTAETRRTCTVCSTVMITVHGKAGEAWREWLGDGSSCSPARAKASP